VAGACSAEPMPMLTSSAEHARHVRAGRGGSWKLMACHRLIGLSTPSYHRQRRAAAHGWAQGEYGVDEGGWTVKQLGFIYLGFSCFSSWADFSYICQFCWAACKL